ncbi:hypothetical protein ABXT08_03425 [Chryseobacterium sp. NRRL B-14859]|uniref:hypothetical protein n=1 Tax=unclassified Chryseobacterium TaxID=2593645 RepID=UPI000F454125|nr:hypothetical protein [Chryseobacterium sp. G0240]ROI00987.1 hypothetical protein EGI16_19005 [Chryseobacterium sp. G0240]
MTEVQESKITEYLVTQQLSLDILVEIKDHMVSQISTLELEENLGFEKAFSKVKESWDGEFKMVDYLLFYPEKIPLIAKRIIKEKYKDLLKKSMKIGLLALGINLMLIFMVKNQDQYDLFFRLFNGSFLLAAVSIWAFNYKIWKYLKADFKYKGRCFYTMYQQNMGLMVLCIFSMVQVTMKSGHYAYQFFREKNHTDILLMLPVLIIPFILQTALVFTLFNFIEHKRNLNKMQEFISQ